MSASIIANLLQFQPLYRKVEIEKSFCYQGRLQEITFQYLCQKENSDRTFKLVLGPEKAIKALSGRELEDSFEPFISDNAVDFFQYYIGHCQSCKEYSVHFLLHVFSEGNFQKMVYDNPALQFLSADDIKRLKEIQSDDQSKLFIRKVGQWPTFQIKPETTLYNFLDKEDKDYYNKALICLSQSYGVAAFAYLRKIVEKEIIKIVEELTHDSSGNSEEIKKLLTEYRAKKQISLLIDKIYPHLPNSLKVLNNNPIKLLYGYLSDGLHNQSDEVCLKHAIDLDKLLQFTVKRLREDQTEIKEIREVMNGLRLGE